MEPWLKKQNWHTSTRSHDGIPRPASDRARDCCSDVAIFKSISGNARVDDVMCVGQQRHVWRHRLSVDETRQRCSVALDRYHTFRVITTVSKHLVLMTFQLKFYYCDGRRRKYCNECLCLSVCLSARISPEPHTRSFSTGWSNCLVSLFLLPRQEPKLYYSYSTDVDIALRRIELYRNVKVVLIFWRL